MIKTPSLAYEVISKLLKSRQRHNLRSAQRVFPAVTLSCAVVLLFVFVLNDFWNYLVCYKIFVDNMYQQIIYFQNPLKTSLKALFQPFFLQKKLRSNFFLLLRPYFHLMRHKKGWLSEAAQSSYFSRIFTGIRKNPQQQQEKNASDAREWFYPYIRPILQL